MTLLETVSFALFPSTPRSEIVTLEQPLQCNTPLPLPEKKSRRIFDDFAPSPNPEVVFYSVFALLPFGGLVVADVLLYASALFLEFASLVALRKKEPDLRGSFRIPFRSR